MKAEKIQDNDIVDSAVSAGLADTLKGKRHFTVFAPSDEAFAVLPAGTVESMLGLGPIDWRGK